MTKYFWPVEGQTFTQLLDEHIANSQATSLPAKQKAPSKKRGRPLGSKNKNKDKVEILVEAEPKRRGRKLGSKNKEGHKAGRKDIYRHSPTFLKFISTTSLTPHSEQFGMNV